jgi:hypothetical protein
MPSTLTLVFIFDKSSLIKAGTRKGKTENHTTTIAIRTQIINFSNLCGRRDKGVISPIVTASDKTTNLIRPAVSQQNGATKPKESLYLLAARIAIRIRGREYPIIQYGFRKLENTLPIIIPSKAVVITPAVSNHGFTIPLLSILISSPVVYQFSVIKSRELPDTAVENGLFYDSKQFSQICKLMI